MDDAKTQAKLKKREAEWELARRGNLSFLLDDGQKVMREALHAFPGERIYANMARRRGKTYFLVAMAVEFCLRRPNSDVKYAASTIKAIKKMVRPSLRKIIGRLPPELKPLWKGMDGEYAFPNGSVITLAGCDNENYENLRGTEAHLVILDEAGFMDDLESVVEDVLAPQTLETGGSFLIASTPPKTMDHYAIRLLEGAKRREKEIGRTLYFHHTIYDNPRLSPPQIEAFIAKQAASRGQTTEAYKKSPSFRREFMAELLPDMEKVVIPEWSEGGWELCTGEVPTPEHFDAYVGSDIGYRDGWAVLWGYWDFQNAWLVILDELLRFRTTTDVMAQAMLAKEKELWGPKKPYRRVSDNDLLTIADLHRNGISFTPTLKDDKENQVNRIREWVRMGKLKIHPRCKLLLHQIGTTTWNDNRTTYLRSEYGHGDLLDALVYLGRNVDRQRNPAPSPSNVVPFHQMRIGPGPSQLSADGDTVRRAFLAPVLKLGR